MKKHLTVYDLPLFCELMQDRGLLVTSVTTNDPRYMKDGREIRNVVVTWSQEPEPHEKELAEWCVWCVIGDYSPTVKHVVEA